MLNKTKIGLGFIGIALVSQVFCTVHRVSGSIIKYKLNDSKIFMILSRDGLVDAFGWYEAPLYDPECTGDCTHIVSYDENKTPIYFNIKTIEYNDNSQPYAFNFGCSSTMSHDCKSVKSCNSFMLSFTGTYKTPDQ
ncbi:hypothetical protein BB559_003163 [Furculomyces boomerangus]|uniref:Uncharacterized protein n=1 Tax=Furculomyces boomerangus TaxID=61424 RepID=A0A2T9YN48_9FUNG|nr:hypothetical protein BB559_003163 [Furculomyces boomerangus]